MRQRPVQPLPPPTPPVSFDLRQLAIHYFAKILLALQESSAISCAGGIMMAPDQALNLNLTPGQLRRLKVLADLTDDQLSLFVSLVEPVQVKPNRIIVKRNDPADSMYLLLGGEVRVSDTVEGRETTLAMLETGDFFGEMCLFDEGSRSADVVTNRDCILLKITRQAFDDLIAQHPAIGALFLRAMIRIIAGRVRSMDKKYIDSMLLSRFWNKGSSSQAAVSASAPESRQGTR